MSSVILIVGVIAICFFGFKYLKPYFIKHDTTVLFCGGLGSGKSLSSVKEAESLYRVVSKRIWRNNLFVKLFKKGDIKEKPLFISNMPVCDWRKRIITTPLTKGMLTLDERIPEYSVVLIDEISMIANQFNWNNQDVKYHMNEFIQLFRHYVGGYLVLNCQAESELVKQIRVKLNSYYICSNFKKWFFIYKVDILHRLCLGDETGSSSNFIDDDYKRHFGLLLFRKYDSRYLRNRYKNVKNECSKEKHKCMQVNEILRFEQYRSKCD